jgi:hypothetical protein
VPYTPSKARALSNLCYKLQTTFRMILIANLRISIMKYSTSKIILIPSQERPLYLPIP